MIEIIRAEAICSAASFHKMVDEMVEAAMSECPGIADVAGEAIRNCVLQSILWNVPVAGNA